jgi:hypothetical protein
MNTDRTEERGTALTSGSLAQRPRRTPILGWIKKWLYGTVICVAIVFTVLHFFRATGLDWRYFLWQAIYFPLIGLISAVKREWNLV